MSTPPRPSEPAADPLGEALHRLEESIAGATSLPVARPKGSKGQSLKSLLPEEEQTGGAAVMPRPRPAPVLPELSDTPTPRNGVAQGSVPVPRALETAAKTDAERRRGQRVVDRGEPAARPSVAVAVPTVGRGRERGSGDTQLLSEDDFSPYLDDDGMATVSVRKGNRRVGRSPWQLFVWVGLMQVAVLLAVALVAWPMLKGMLAARDEAPNGGGGGAGSATAEVPGEDVGEGLESLRAEIEALRHRMRATPEDAWEELEFLGKRNRLLESGDRAIENADRAAYDHLVGLAGSATDERLRSGAAAEVLRVRFAYSTGLRTESHTLPVGQLFPSLRGKSEMALGTDQLVEVLLDTEVESAHRVKAAYLLADRRGGKAADALAAAVAEDVNLDVVREAAMTFGEMTGYRSSDLLDTGRLGAWWETNAGRVKAVIGD